MTRALVGLWTLLILYGLLLFGDFLGQALDNFRRNTSQAHGLAASDDGETAARKTFGAIVQAGGSSSHLNLLPVLSAGSERPL